MANTWMTADSQLSLMLDQFRTYLAAHSAYKVHLFKNDFSPSAGSILTDFVEADFAGYVYAALANTAWGSVTVSAHVASMTNSIIPSYTASPSMVGTQAIYGYYVTDDSDNLAWGERFATTPTVGANDVLTNQLIYRHTNLPY